MHKISFPEASWPDWFEEDEYKTNYSIKIGKVIDIAANPEVTVYPLREKEIEGIFIEVYL